MAEKAAVCTAAAERAAVEQAVPQRVIADKDWLVTRQKVLKWIDAWMYILAFPIEGSRREYWTGFEGGFGPKHCYAS